MPSTPQPDFVLERASLADADELAPIFFSAFYSEPYYVAMCPETPACTASWAQTWIHAMNDPATHAMKVTDRKTGKIAAAGKWISPKKESGEKQPGNEENRWADLPAHCDEELANGLFGSFAENRRGFMADRPHYCQCLSSRSLRPRRRGPRPDAPLTENRHGIPPDARRIQGQRRGEHDPEIWLRHGRS